MPFEIGEDGHAHFRMVPSGINWDDVKEKKERYCNVCGHFQLRGKICKKCGTESYWVDHDF